MGAAKPTPAFIARAIEAVERKGYAPVRVEVRQDGSVAVDFVAKGAAPALPSPVSSGAEGGSCDEVFGA